MKAFFVKLLSFFRTFVSTLRTLISSKGDTKVMIKTKYLVITKEANEYVICAANANDAIKMVESYGEEVESCYYDGDLLEEPDHDDSEIEGGLKHE